MNASTHKLQQNTWILLGYYSVLTWLSPDLRLETRLQVQGSTNLNLADHDVDQYSGYLA